MSDSHDLEGIMQRTMQIACPSCGSEQSSRAATCTDCGAELSEDDEEGFSYVSEPERVASGGCKVKITPLERSKNYKALLKAKRIEDGSVSGEEFQTIVSHLKFVGTSGIKVMESAPARARFGTLEGEGRHAVELMEQGFQRLKAGAEQMETYLTTMDANALRAGAAEAEAAFRDIDTSQHIAQELRAQQRDDDEATAS